jgi:hypothetical protein
MKDSLKPIVNVVALIAFISFIYLIFWTINFMKAESKQCLDNSLQYSINRFEQFNHTMSCTCTFEGEPGYTLLVKKNVTKLITAESTNIEFTNFSIINFSNLHFIK